MINIPFDQYQRYKMAADIIEKYRSSKDSFKILEVGANAHRNLEKFLPIDKITYIDIDLPKGFNENNMIHGDATNMQFEDSSFDIVIALDVYEHIPNIIREKFLSEINRVAKYGFIIGGPFNYERVTEAEYRVNSLYKTLYGKDFIWLKEHIENSLPNLNHTKEYLNSKNILFKTINHGDIYLWEHLMGIHFLSLSNKSSMLYKQEIDKFYNRYIYNLDMFTDEEESYRTFIVGGTLTSACNNILNKNKLDKLNRDIEINKLLNLCSNFTNIYKDSIKQICCSDEYIEVFIDNRSYKLKVEQDEIVSGNVIEKFIPLDKIILEHGLRIDPCNKRCIINIESILLKNEENIQVAKYNTNAKMSSNSIHYFDNDDPQIYILDCIGNCITGIIIRISYISYDNLNFNSCDYLIDLVNDNINNTTYMLKSEIDKKDLIIKEKDLIIKEKENEIKEKNVYIEDLNLKNISNKIVIENISRELDTIKKSTLWKVMKFLKM